MNTLYGPGTLWGEYDRIGEVREGQVISMHEWAVRRDTQPTTMTLRIAERVAEIQEELPRPVMVVGTTSSKHCLEQVYGKKLTDREFYEIEGQSATRTGKNLGSWGEVTAVQRYMSGKDLERVVHVGHARHIGRIYLQAVAVGIEGSIIPDRLPSGWAHDSDQPWTAGPFAWALHELIGAPVLRQRGQL